MIKDTAGAKSVTQLISGSKSSVGMTGTVGLHILDQNGNKVDYQSLYSGIDGGELVDNRTLDTAKVILSRMLAGDSDYKLAKIGFGNAGHNFLNPKSKIDVLAEDTELKVITHIRDSLQLASTSHYLYEDDNTNLHRLSYIEKDILPEHITFGDSGNEFIIRVPITYDDFNRRVGDATVNTVLFEDNISKFDMIESGGSLVTHRNVDAAGAIVDSGTNTEVARIDDAGTIRYKFLNGVDANGDIDTTNHGERPQEVSEIMLCTDIIGDGSSEPYKKLASSITSSGLLSLPESFSFLYEWKLSWSFE